MTLLSHQMMKMVTEIIDIYDKHRNDHDHHQQQQQININLFLIIDHHLDKQVPFQRI